MSSVFDDVTRARIRLRVLRRWQSPGTSVVHGFTDRRGGVSRGPFASLNIGFHVGDEPAAVWENRRLVGRAVDADPMEFVAGEQVHGSAIAVVTEQHRGRGARGPQDALPGVDGLVTRTRGLLLMAFFADCVPVLLYDAQTPAIGVVHAGWRGTARDAVGQAMAVMQSALGTRPAAVEAVVGPSIGPCCYAVGDDVAAQISDRAADPGGSPGRAATEVVMNRDGRVYANLPEANARLLERAGVLRENIFVDPTCTRCHAQRFFSHRGDGGVTGRFAAIIGLRTLGPLRS